MRQKTTKNNSQSMPYFVRKSFLRLVSLSAYIFICLDHQLAIRDDFTRSKLRLRKNLYVYGSMLVVGKGRLSFISSMGGVGQADGAG